MSENTPELPEEYPSPEELERMPLVPGLAPLTAFPPDEQPDPDHLLTEEDWREVQADAELQAARIAEGLRPQEAPHQAGAGRYGTGLPLALSGVVVAPNHGANRGRPTFGVFHSMETPLRAGYAASLARYAARGPGVSWHYGVDPAETWGVLPDELVAWHVGGANPRSLGLEQAGYARFSSAEWLTPEGHAQARRSADVVRMARDRYGIGIYWMTDQQLRDAHAGRIIGGWTTHDQCRRVIGQTSHTDPGKYWPGDMTLELARGQVPAPVPPPAPTPDVGIPRPPVLRWHLPAGHWLGNMAGPALQHGGHPAYDSEQTRALVENVQAHLIFLGCAGGSRDWRARTWDDGRWQAPTDVAMTTFHQRFYPGQPYPAQCWSDDYAVLVSR